MHNRLIISLLAIVLLISSAHPVFAQDPAKGPVYVIQPGDTLNIIAQRFNISVDDLIAANGIQDPNILGAGTELVIPGLQGVTGRLDTKTIALGEDLSGLSRQYNVPTPMIVKLNRITSPAEVYAGSSLIIPQDDQEAIVPSQTVLPKGYSLLEAAVTANANPWALASSNQLANTWSVLPGEALSIPGSEQKGVKSAPIPMVAELKMDTLPLVQGITEVVRVTTTQPLQLSGSLNGMKLHFFPLDASKNEYVALQGIHAMAKTGLTPFLLKGMAENGQAFDFQQMVLLAAGQFAQDPPLSVPPETLDPANTQPEEDLVKQVTSSATPTRYWTDTFHNPVDEPVCIKSWYGNRRSYNGGGFDYFHTGLDYGVCANLNIYAPAGGVVVFAGPLTVRGNATIIDHGWGVYSGFYHQSEIKVKVGDKVEAGQLIGLIGGTGRVTGPHLHWDVFVNGIQVQPYDWLEKSFP